MNGVGISMLKNLKLVKDLVDLVAYGWSLFTWLGIASIATAVTLSFAGSIWARVQGLPLSAAIMLGVCFFAALLVIGLAFTRLVVPLFAPVRSKKVKPNYAAWRSVQEFTLRDAAVLWTNHEPRAGLATSPQAGAWLTALKGAVTRMELLPSGSFTQHDIQHPGPETTVSRAALTEFAKSIDQHPYFLRG
jgi:hypothetical protein